MAFIKKFVRKKLNQNQEDIAKEQYKEFLAVIKANRSSFDNRKLRIFKAPNCFGYKDAGAYGAVWAIWYPDDNDGEVLVDRLRSVTKSYRTFGGWLRAVRKDLEF